MQESSKMIFNEKNGIEVGLKRLLLCCCYMGDTF